MYVNDLLGDTKTYNNKHNDANNIVIIWQPCMHYLDIFTIIGYENTTNSAYKLPLIMSIDNKTTNQFLIDS